MNNSGICIRELIEYFKIDAENVIVFHDDLDIDFGKIKTKFGGSVRGTMVQSHRQVYYKDYSRVRIGIGKPNNQISVSDYVLNDFNDEEISEISKISENITKSLSIQIKNQIFFQTL